MRSLWLCAVALLACEPVLEDGADGGDVFEGAIDGGSNSEADSEADSGLDSDARPDSGPILEGPVPQEICGGTPVYVLGDPAVWDSRGRIELPELVPLSSRFNRACDGSEGDGGDEVVVRFMTERPGIYLFDVTGPATQVSSQRACADNWIDACYPVPPADPEGSDRFVRFPRRMAAGELVYVTIETTGPIHLGVQAPVELGEVCGWQGDVWVAECEEGLVCVDQACVAQRPPQVEALEVSIEGDAVHMVAAGTTGTGGDLWFNLDVLDAEGTVLMELGESFHSLDRAVLGADGRFEVAGIFKAWGQADVLARAATAALTARDQHGRGEAVAVVPGRLPRVAPGEACDPQRVVNRCEVGSVCVEGADRVVACQPWTARAWRHGPRVGVRIDIPTAIDWVLLLPQVEGQAYRGGTAPQRPYEGFSTLVWAELPDATHIQVGFNPGGPFGEEDPQVVRIEEALLRAVGEGCDPDRFMDVCAEGSACIDRVCSQRGRPTIDAARAYVSHYQSEHLVLQVEGHDAESDVAVIDVALLDANGAVLQASSQQVRPWLVEAEDGPAFTLRWTGGLAPLGVALRVQLTDAQGVVGAPVVAPFEAVEVVGAGEVCHLDGAPAVCGGSTLCVQRRGEVWPYGVCEVADLECPAEWTVTELAPGSVRGQVGAVDRTEACLGVFGSVRAVPESVYRFTAPEAGRWRFSAQGVDGAQMVVATRRGCGEAGWGSEVACEAGLETRIPLAIDETVYVVVEPVAAGASGEFILTAER